MDWNLNYKHLRAGVVVDTNLFLLMLVGRHDLSKLKSFRATAKYDPDIYKLLESLVAKFRSVHVTSNIMTEVDNLSRQTPRTEWPHVSRTLLSICRTASEEYFRSEQLISSPGHADYGLTDCSIIELARRDVLVVTDDARLTARLERRRRGVINLSRYVGR